MNLIEVFWILIGILGFGLILVEKDKPVLHNFLFKSENKGRKSRDMSTSYRNISGQWMIIVYYK